MIIEIPDDNSIVKWRYKDNEDWKSAEISDLIKAYERPQGEWIEEGTEIGAFGIKYTWNKCNKCGWSSSLILPKNFCPNCGAKMFHVEHTTKKEEDHETM